MFIYLDISLEENVRRLLARRRDNAVKKGKQHKEETLPETAYENMLAFRDRSRSVWTHAHDKYDRFPKQCLTIPEHFSGTESATAARAALAQLRNGETLEEDNSAEVMQTV